MINRSNLTLSSSSTGWLDVYYDDWIVLGVAADGLHRYIGAFSDDLSVNGDGQINVLRNPMDSYMHNNDDGWETIKVNGVGVFRLVDCEAGVAIVMDKFGMNQSLCLITDEGELQLAQHISLVPIAVFDDATRRPRVWRQ